MAVNDHGEKRDTWLISVPESEDPHVSPMEQSTVHPILKGVFYTKNLFISLDLPDPDLTYGWLLSGVEIDFGVNDVEQSPFYMI